MLAEQEENIPQSVGPAVAKENRKGSRRTLHAFVQLTPKPLPHRLVGGTGKPRGKQRFDHPNGLFVTSTRSAWTMFRYRPSIDNECEGLILAHALHNLKVFAF